MSSSYKSRSLRQSHNDALELNKVNGSYVPIDRNSNEQKLEKSIPKYSCYICYLAPLDFRQLRRHMVVFHNKAYLGGHFVEKPDLSTDNQQENVEKIDQKGTM